MRNNINLIISCPKPTNIYKPCYLLENTESTEAVPPLSELKLFFVLFGFSNHYKTYKKNTSGICNGISLLAYDIEYLYKRKCSCTFYIHISCYLFMKTTN